MYLKGFFEDKGWCFCKERPFLQDGDNHHRTWAEIRYLAEVRMGLHASRDANTTNIYVGHLGENDERDLVALSDDYIVKENDVVVLRRFPVSYKCKPWLPLSKTIEESEKKCQEEWTLLSEQIQSARQRSVSEDVLLRLCQQQQTQGIPKFLDERCLHSHPSHAYICDHYHGYRLNDDEVLPVQRPPCHMCWDLLKPSGHLSKNCPAANKDSRWQGLDALKRPTGIPWTHLKEVDPPTTLDEILAVEWHDPVSGKFWCKRVRKKSGSR